MLRSWNIGTARSSRVVVAVFLVVAWATANGQDSSAPGSRPSKSAAKPKAERKLADFVRSIAVSQSGLLIAATDYNGELSLLSSENTDRRAVFVEPRGFWDLQFSDDGRALIAMTSPSSDWHYTIHVIDPDKGKVLRSIEWSEDGERGSYRDLRFESGTTRLVLERSLGVETWDVTTGERISAKSREYDSKVYDRVSRMYCRAEGSAVALYAADAKEPTWRVDVNSDHVIRNAHAQVQGFTTDASIVCVIVINSERELLADRRVVALSTRDGSVSWTRIVSRDVLGVSDLVPGADTVAEIDDGALCLVDAHDGKVVLEAPTTKKYTCCAACADGKVYWVGARDGSIVRIEPKPPTAKK